MKPIDPQRVSELEVAAVMSQSRPFALTYLSILVVVILLAFGAVPNASLAAWAGAYAVFILARTFAADAYGSDELKSTASHIRRWRWYIAVSSSAHGVLVGALAWVAFPALNFPAQIILIATVVVYNAAAAVYIAAMFWALASSITLSTFPYVIAWCFGHSDMRMLVVALLVSTWALNIYLSWNHQKFLRQSWRMLAINEYLSAELTRKNLALEDAGRSLKRLVAMASHDLRQPVHSFGVTVAQLDEYDDPKTLRLHFDRLKESTFIVSDMLQELMDLSSLERSTSLPEFTAVRLDPVLEQLLLTHELAARRKGLKLVIRTDTHLTVHSNADLLRRVLMNLVSNAVKYTLQGEVTVVCQRVAHTVSIRVIDSGIGIPAPQLDEIFRDYVRLDGARDVGEGIGLGLAVVRRAVDLLGHRLDVSSSVGVGSTFELTVNASSALQPEPAPASVRTGSSQGDAALAVLIEDDPYALDALSYLVRSWGYAVVGAASGDEAVARLAPGARPAVVVADFRLGALATGLDAIALIRGHVDLPDLPAILLTGDIGDALKERARAARVAIAYKPYSPVQLRRDMQAAKGRTIDGLSA